MANLLFHFLNYLEIKISGFIYDTKLLASLDLIGWRESIDCMTMWGTHVTGAFRLDWLGATKILILAVKH